MTHVDQIVQFAPLANDRRPERTPIDTAVSPDLNVIFDHNRACLLYLEVTPRVANVPKSIGSHNTRAVQDHAPAKAHPPGKASRRHEALYPNRSGTLHR